MTLWRMHQNSSVCVRSSVTTPSPASAASEGEGWGGVGVGLLNNQETEQPGHLRYSESVRQLLRLEQLPTRKLRDLIVTEALLTTKPLQNPLFWGAMPVAGARVSPNGALRPAFLSLF